MAFNPKLLNNIAASVGSFNIFLYRTDLDNRATINVSGYFNDMKRFGLTQFSIIFVSAVDHTYIAQVVWDGTETGEVTVEALSAFV